jgi:carbonic anhydrase
MPGRTVLAALIGMLLAAIAAPSQAAKWVAVGNKDAARIEVDASSVHSPSAGKSRIWHREVYSRPQVPDSGAFSYTRVTSLTEFQCEQRLAATLQSTYAGRDGGELKTESFDPRDLKPVAPDSGLDAVRAYACRSRTKAVAEAAPPAPQPAPLPVSVEVAEPAKKGKGGKAEATPPSPPPRWSYAGVDKWGSLSKEYASCSLGQRQSPIDIRHSVRADLPAIDFAYRATPLAIVDTGHGLRVETPGAGAILVGQESYELQHVDFHRPGEERIDGKGQAMSIHLVHQSKSGKIAIVAVMVEAGKENALVRNLWTHWPLEPEVTATRGDVKIDPAQFLPAKRSYYTYLGSLSEPPCTEGVLWLVLKAPIQVSKEQIASFATVYKNNARAVQPVNGRVIKESR